MKFPNSRLALASLCLASVTAPAFAEIKLNDQFSVSGFLAGSYALETPNPGKSGDRFDLDNGLLAFRGKSGPAGFVASVYHEPGTPQETTLLDAAVSYETPVGLTVTAGRFQSILAYEAYFAVDNPNIGFANNELLTIAPGYHSGIKVEHATDTWSTGVALLDSVYSGGNYLKGDGELKNNQGFEAMLSFKGLKDVVITVDGGYEGETRTTPQAVVGDIWVAWQVNAGVKVAADYARKDGGRGDRGSNWMLLVDHQLHENLSAAFRVSGEKLDGGGSFTRYTLTPSLRLSSGLTLRAEVSRTDYKNHPVHHVTSAGVQAFLKF
jgi:hypothetical protein